jgi:phage-related protein
VRDWLKELEKDDRKTIGEDIKLIQFRWPLGLPLVRKMEADLWEVRSHLNGGRIARVFFTVRNGDMALLHAFVKKSQKTPANDLTTAQRRRDLWINEQSI